MAKLYIITAQDVEDNLVSDLQDVPLSANMGRVLNTNKVEKNQGTQYAGKVLGIGDDGMVVPVEGGGGDYFARIITNSPSGGTISPSGVVVVLKGESKSFTFTASTGYQIADVKIDGVSKGVQSSWSFTNIQEDHTVDVTFSKIRFTVSKNVTGPGSISGEGNPEYGSTQVYTISPSTGARITGVSVDGTSKGVVSSVTLNNITANHTVSATFIMTYTVNASAGSNGSISPSGTTTYDAGATPTYTISPNTGYMIDTLKVNEQSVTPTTPTTYVFPALSSNMTIVVTFKVIPQINYSMTIPSGSGNSVSKNITYGDSAAGMTESQRDALIKEHTRFAVVNWNGSKPVVNYWLYRNDLTKKATDKTCNTSSGTASNLTGTDGDVVVLYDPVWWKWSKSGNNHTVIFTWDDPGDSSWTTPHRYGDNLSSTTLAEYVGLGVFPAYNSSSQMRSINTSSEPTGNVTQNNFYVAATYGRNWQYNNKLPMTYAWYITCLYFVKGDRNCQAAYGNGIVSSGSGYQGCNANWSATNAWNNGTTADQTHGVTALGVHNPWGQKYEFLGECRNDSGTIKFSALCGKDHYNIESGTASTWVSASTSTSSGSCVTEICGSTCPQFPFFGTSISGTDYSIYYADAWYGSSSSARCVYVGGYYSNGLQAGPLFAYADDGASYAYSAYGARLHVTII